MCEANAYLIKNGEEELIMRSVDILRPEDGMIYLQDVFGEQRWLKAHIKEMNLVEHRIVFEEDKGMLE
jgi:predicted RNA-binding protein